MHSSRIRTAHLLTVSRSIPCISGGGGFCPPPLNAAPPRCRPPTPDAELPPQRQTPRRQTTPGCRSPLDAEPPPDADPPDHVTCDACWEANPSCGQTNSCKNIILSQTSFCGRLKHCITRNKLGIFHSPRITFSD